MPGLRQCRWLMNGPERRHQMELYKAAEEKYAEYYTQMHGRSGRE